MMGELVWKKFIRLEEIVVLFTNNPCFGMFAAKPKGRPLARIARTGH